MRFDEAFIQQVRAANDIVSLVGEYVGLKKAGNGTFKGLCPMHGEKTPSFHVHAAPRSFYMCFGCGATGDAITFVREHNGYSFTEAVKYLAQRAGIEIPQLQDRGDSQAEPRVKREVLDDLYAIHKTAQRFYQDALATTEGTKCREYLVTRGIKQPAISKFGLGFAPDRWDAFYEYLRATHPSDQKVLDLAVQAGLLRTKETANGLRYYDQFRNRLMFPVRNLAGNTIAFSGRVLPGASQTAQEGREPAKYINSPESPVYKKGEALYGLSEARQAMRASDRCILVEGNLDLVRLSQEGLEDVVAPLGTALTREQCRLMRRFVGRVVGLYDGDKAGHEASRKAAELGIAEDVRLDIAELPEGMDPDSFVTKNNGSSVKLLTQMFSVAKPGWEYLVGRTIEETGALTSAQGAKLAIERLAPVLETVDPKARPLFEMAMGKALGLDRQDVARLARGRALAPKPATRAITMVALKPSDLEIALVALMALDAGARALFLGWDVAQLFQHSGMREAANVVACQDGTVAESMMAIEDDGLRSLVVTKVATIADGCNALNEFKRFVAPLRMASAHRKRTKLASRMRSIDLADAPALAKIAEEMRRLSAN